MILILCFDFNLWEPHAFMYVMYIGYFPIMLVPYSYIYVHIFKQEN